MRIRFCSIHLWFQSLNIVYEVFSQMVYKFIYFVLFFDVRCFSKIKLRSKKHWRSDFYYNKTHVLLNIILYLSLTLLNYVPYWTLDLISTLTFIIRYHWCVPGVTRYKTHQIIIYKNSLYQMKPTNLVLFLFSFGKLYVTLTFSNLTQWRSV